MDPIPTPPEVTEAVKLLKERSDTLCKVMADIFPMEPEQLLTMQLSTLIQLGYTITPPAEPKYK